MQLNSLIFFLLFFLTFINHILLSPIPHATNLVITEKSSQLSACKITEFNQGTANIASNNPSSPSVSINDDSGKLSN